MFTNKEAFSVLPDKNGNFNGNLTTMTLHKLIDDLFFIDTFFDQCKIFPRLSRAHINLTSFQKNSVRLAMQVINCVFLN